MIRIITLLFLGIMVQCQSVRAEEVSIFQLEPEWEDNLEYNQGEERNADLMPEEENVDISDNNGENEENIQEDEIVEEAIPEPIVEVINPSNFTPDFINSLYHCKPNSEQQNLSGQEEVYIVGMSGNRCRLRYDEFELSVPFDLLPNIRSMSDIRQLLRNQDITSYLPNYEYYGLLHEIEYCSKHNELHNAYLYRTTKNDVVITTGVSSRANNGGCVIRLINLLNVGEQFTDYSVTCNLRDVDVALILDTYKNILSQSAKTDTSREDAEIMYRMQQAGLCNRPQS